MSSCEDAWFEEPMSQMDMKSANKGNDKLTGFDEWGFNWWARQFNGYVLNMMFGDHYFEQVFPLPHFQQEVYHGEGIEFWNEIVDKYYLDLGGFEWHYFPDQMPVDLLDAKVNAHWNEGLISKDGVYPPTWIDSNAWIVFKYSGNFEGKQWMHLRKLVAAKSTDIFVKDDVNGDGVIDFGDGLGTWYNADGDEIGFESMYFPGLIVVQVVNNGDVPSVFYDEYNSPWGPGYGKYKLK